MARTRFIKPAFFQNEALSGLEPLTRLLFIGLWCFADRSGRLEDRPRRIRVQILPYDCLADKEVDAMLERLAEAGFILRYAVEKARFIEIVNFEKHQYPHHKEPVSNLPAPPPEESPRLDSVETRDGLGKDSVKTESNPSSTPLHLKPRSLSPSTPLREVARDPPIERRERESRSQFSLKECREYAETLPEIKAPGGFAKAIWRSGEEDDSIAAFQARGGAEEDEHERLKRIRSLRHSRPDN